MLTKTAHLADRTVRYLEAGSGRALVLIHGFPLSADSWLPQLLRVPPGWRVVAPDLRGFRGAGAVGSDDAALDHATVDTHAADVLALMTHLDIDRAVVGGLSMGGYVTLALVRRAPARVSGLILANTRAGADSEQGRAGRNLMIELVQREGPPAVAREMLPKLLGATSTREQPDLVDAVRLLIEANTTAGIAAAVRALRDRPDATPVLSSISCPTLIITGDEDTLIPVSESEAMHRAIRGSTLIILPRAGHLSNLESPQAFNQAIWDWSD